MKYMSITYTYIYIHVCYFKNLHIYIYNLSDPKNVPCFLNIYIYHLNLDVSNLFAIEDPLICV